MLNETRMEKFGRTHLANSNFGLVTIFFKSNAHLGGFLIPKLIHRDSLVIVSAVVLALNRADGLVTSGLLLGGTSLSGFEFIVSMDRFFGSDFLLNFHDLHGFDQILQGLRFQIVVEDILATGAIHEGHYFLPVATGGVEKSHDLVPAPENVFALGLRFAGNFEVILGFRIHGDGSDGV